ncbi:type 1 glutamine amidotransferase [Terasakiella pusilla]|uniref:type 1 glutamine amidotransferase n=1 Tax=Terasakiella pusilla TaxID=64973 RepID=UPI003AA97393
MTTIGLLVCDTFTDDLRAKYKCDYEDLFIDALLDVDKDLSFVAYHVYRGILPSSVQECDGWLITGSKAGVYEQLPWMETLEAFLKEAYEADAPIIGVCFGHQILAYSLGGKVEKSEKGWGLGLQSYELLEPIAGLEGGMDLYAIHQDQVVTLPDEARVFAKTDHCPNAGLRYKKRAVSFQPHPEFSREMETDLIMRNKGGTISTVQADQALESLEVKPAQGREIMSFMVDFIRG